jgi:ABC-type branched-subunit amino acid transport system substrate-binding protein
VMPLRSDEHRRRGVEVAAGLAFALGIPGSKTKLLVRDDQGDMSALDDTLALLNADGAAVIVAGYDTREADVALAYAERTNVPLILLRPPTRPVKPEGPVFVLGESSSDVHAALVRALSQKGERRIAVLLGDPGSASKEIDPAVVAIQPCGASLEFVRSSNAGAIVLEGDPACSKAALAALDGKTQLAFGFDARVPDRDAGLFASAGQFPLTSRSTDNGLVAYRKLGRGEPSWWTALGHDAGMLVEDAVVGLPTEEDAAALASALRKRIVADGIAKAERPLWTTDAKGFDGGRVVARKIGATTIAGKR